MPRAERHRWAFKARFRRHAFGWRSQPAIQRVKEAVAEIKSVARTDAVLAAEGAVVLIERLSPALENIDSSSGAIGAAVNNALATLVPLVTGAPADAETRTAWLARLFEAHGADQIPYIEDLAEYWGELCASKEVASEWADRLLGITQRALSPDSGRRGHFHGTTACLSALYAAERYDDLLGLLEAEAFWPYKRWAVRALAAQGRRAEAIQLAEDSRSPWASDWDIDRLCEEILLSAGATDDAYASYGLTANRGGTHLATFRAVAKKYPHKSVGEILSDLVTTTPGDEGKWFAAAKDAGLFREALALAERTPCDPRTLSRAARDYADDQPAFALGAGLLALYWLAQGYGYEITGADVWAAYSATIQVAERLGKAEQARADIRRIAASTQDATNAVARILGRDLGLSSAPAHRGRSHGGLTPSACRSPRARCPRTTRAGPSRSRRLRRSLICLQGAFVVDRQTRRFRQSDVDIYLS